jgi:hypothetical protein
MGYKFLKRDKKPVEKKKKLDDSSSEDQET